MSESFQQTPMPETPTVSIVRRRVIIRERDERWRSTQPYAINPDWRRRRMNAPTDVRSRMTARLVSDVTHAPEEWNVWLQRGGWRIAALLVCVPAVMFLVSLWLFNTADSRSQVVLPAAVPVPTVVAVSPDAVPATAVPAVFVPARFTVAHTNGLEVRLRDIHASTGNVVAMLAEGTSVEQTGPEVSGPDRVWRPVRTADGLSGWLAADFLAPAP